MIAPANPFPDNRQAPPSRLRMPIDSDVAYPQSIDSKPPVVSRVVARHPVAAIATAVSLGVALGWLFKRKIR